MSYMQNVTDSFHEWFNDPISKKTSTTLLQAIKQASNIKLYALAPAIEINGTCINIKKYMYDTPNDIDTTLKDFSLIYSIYDDDVEHKLVIRGIKNVEMKEIENKTVWNKLSIKPRDGEACWLFFKGIEYDDWKSGDHIDLGYYNKDEDTFFHDYHGRSKILLWLPANKPPWPPPSLYEEDI